MRDGNDSAGVIRCNRVIIFFIKGNILLPFSSFFVSILFSFFLVCSTKFKAQSTMFFITFSQLSKKVRPAFDRPYIRKQILGNACFHVVYNSSNKQCLDNNDNDNNNR